MFDSQASEVDLIPTKENVNHIGGMQDNSYGDLTGTWFCNYIEVAFHFVIATFNRADTTRRSLTTLKAAISAAGSPACTITVVDSNSTDGTAEVVRQIFSDANVYSVSQETFWAEAMSFGERAVLRNRTVEEADYVVWLNDDTLFDQDSFVRIMSFLPRQTLQTPQVFVAPLLSEDQHAVRTGGLSRTRNPLRFETMEICTGVQESDTFNGNFVIVPVHRARTLGPINGAFGHHRADLEYGLRNLWAGGLNVVLPNSFGISISSAPSGIQPTYSWVFYKSVKGAGHKRSREIFLQFLGLNRLERKIIGLANDVQFFCRLAFVSLRWGRRW